MRRRWVQYGAAFVRKMVGDLEETHAAVRGRRPSRIHHGECEDGRAGVLAQPKCSLRLPGRKGRIALRARRCAGTSRRPFPGGECSCPKPGFRASPVHAVVILCFIGLILGVTPTRAQDGVERAILRTGADIEKATRELTGLREAHSRQRVPLATELETLQADVKALRIKDEQLQLAQQQGAQQREALTAQVEGLEAECNFLYSLLSEYRRSMEVRLSRAEATEISEPLSHIDGKLAAEDDVTALPGVAGNLLMLATTWNEQRLGGLVIEGEALDADGIEHGGRFAICGPAAYFAGKDGSLSGWVVARLGSAAASIHPLPGQDEQDAVARLVAGEESLVPVDVSGGDALKVAAAKKSLLEHIREGGAVMVPLAILAVWALIVALAKTVQIRRVRLPDANAVNQVLGTLKGGDAAAAQTQAQALSPPLGPILAEAIEHRSADREQIEEILHERILMIVPWLEKHLGTLAVFGGVAPLLGLLGTVTGMIHTFQLVTIFGTGDAKLLSGGISEALVTTEFGLVIAIPVLLVHAYLSRRVRSLIADLEQGAADFVAQLKEEG